MLANINRFRSHTGNKPYPETEVIVSFSGWMVTCVAGAGATAPGSPPDGSKEEMKPAGNPGCSGGNRSP